jgi:hypothetical protein
MSIYIRLMAHQPALCTPENVRCSDDIVVQVVKSSCPHLYASHRPTPTSSLEDALTCLTLSTVRSRLPPPDARAERFLPNSSLPRTLGGCVHINSMNGTLTDFRGTRVQKSSRRCLLLFRAAAPAAVRQAAASVLAAEAALRTTRNDVAFETRSAFFNLGRALSLHEVARDAVRQYQARLDQVNAFADVGQRTPLIGNLLDSMGARPLRPACMSTSMG